MNTISAPAPLRLYLIRHGETAWSLTGQHTGLTDIPLNARGEEEARQLAPHLNKIAFDSVLTSPLQRASQTCALVGLEIMAKVTLDLAEWNYGDYDGRRTVDIQQERAGWNLFRDGCPGGETPAQVSERADRLISHFYTLSGNVALFSHGHFGRVLAARWIGLPIIAGQHFSLDTASFSILGYAPHHREVPVITLWNASQETFAPWFVHTSANKDSQTTVVAAQ